MPIIGRRIGERALSSASRRLEWVRCRPDASWRSFVQETGLRNSAYGADKFGFKGLSTVHWNLTAPTLYEYAVAAGEASLVEGGGVCAGAGGHTGRAPQDKHTVVGALAESTGLWGGNPQIHQPNFHL